MWVGSRCSRLPTEGGLPSFQELRDHIELRIGRAPRYRQKLASVPLGLHAPEWIDDPAFSIDRHVYWAPGSLRRPRRRGDVDTAAPRPSAVGDVDLRERAGGASRSSARPITAWSTGWPRSSSPRCCSTPRPSRSACERERWERRARARRASGCSRAGCATCSASSWTCCSGRCGPPSSPGPRRAADRGGRDARGSRARSAAAAPRPTSVLNGQLSPLRRLALGPAPARGSAHDQARIWHDGQRRDPGGGRRRHTHVPAAPRRGAGRAQGDGARERAQRPASVLGNHISFVFAELPCHEPDPLGRLYQVHASMSRPSARASPRAPISC